MAIPAGDAVWTIDGDISGLDDALTEATGKVTKTTDSIGRDVQNVGAAMTAVGAGLVGTLGGLVTGWAAAGDEIQKMSQRTGVSTEALSELKFILEQNGATLGDFEMANRNLTRTLDEAASGTGKGVEALERLGLSYEDIRAMSPEEQFATIAGAIGNMTDHNDMAAVAMEMFGARVGTKLLPMIKQGSESFEELRQKAHDLGIVFDQDGADAAARYTDMMHELGQSFKGVMIELGPLIADIMEKFVPKVIEAVKAVVEWISNNEGLATGLIVAAAAVGGLMLVVGPLLVMLPGLIALVTSAGVVFGAVAGVLSGPVVLAIGAVVAAGALIYAFWDEITAVFEASIEAIVAVATWMWEGITQAWQAGVDFVYGIWQGFLDFLSAGVDAVVGIVEAMAQPFIWLSEVIGNALALIGFGSSKGIEVPAIPGFAEGGQLTEGMNIVGERGPEAIIKRGSEARVVSAANTGSAGGVTVNMSGVTIASDMDIQRVAQRMGELLKQRMTGVGMTPATSRI
jgi:hypothetical protein